MKKLMMVLLFLVSVGCTSHEFTLDRCNTSCNQCNITGCDLICDELKDGLNSPDCHDVSQTVWECALAHECSFPDECYTEIGDFLSCE